MSDLPSTWVIGNVNDTGEYINGMAFKPSDWEEAGRPIIRIQNLTDPDKPINRTQKDVDQKYIVNRGDLLVSWSATLDAFIWHGEQAVLNQHIFRVVPEQRIVQADFLYYGIKQSIREMAASEHLHGTTMKHINRGPFLAHPFPIPPLPEQKRIVAKLDSLTARSRRARGELDAIPRLVARYKQAVLAAAFESIGQAQVRRLGDLLKEGLIGLVRSKAQQSIDAGIPYVRMQHFDMDGVWNFRDLTRVQVSEVDAKRYELKPDDILFNTRNSYELVGKVAIWPEEKRGYVYNNNLFRMRFGEEVVPRFAVYQMISPQFRSHLLTLKSATTSVCAIYQKALLNSPFFVPDKASQEGLVDLIEHAFSTIDRLAAEHTQASTLLDRLDQSILAKAFRGELAPQDPNDEPASVLLERIRAERAAAPKTKRGRRARAAAS